MENDTPIIYMCFKIKDTQEKEMKSSRFAGYVVVLAAGLLGSALASSARRNALHTGNVTLPSIEMQAPIRWEVHL